MPTQTITASAIKKDLNFLCGLEIDRFGFDLYLVYNGTGKPDYYAFFNGELLFSGSDYKPAPSNCIDSIECLIDLLSFLCVQPGDTDDEYFAKYTEAQMAWAGSYDCECLESIISDFDNKESEYQHGAEIFFKKAYILN